MFADETLVEALEAMLLGREWDDKAQVFTEVAMLFWDRWSDEARQSLTREIAGVADHRVLRVVQEYDRVMVVCPWLARDGVFERFCR